ncbi:MAG: hypothetical protein OEY93_04310 [Anaerolineae bacterium]|nr:hypothetical protein [Anaerolineae bacterium]
MLQSTVVGNIRLLNGSADLVLLVMVAWALQKGGNEVYWPLGVAAGLIVGFVSQMPILVVMIGYGVSMLILQILQSRIWQAPLFSLFVAVLLGSLVSLFVDFLYLLLIGTPLEPGVSFNRVILPGIILNLLIALPVYAFVGEIAKMLIPDEVDL